MFISTITARILHDPEVSRIIGELTCHQSAAYNGAVSILNRAVTIPKRSSRKNPCGFNKILTQWRQEEDHRKPVPYSIHQAGWEQAWEANERMRGQADARKQRTERRLSEGKPLLKRDVRQHRRTLAYRPRKRNPALSITEGRKLTARGHTLTFQHRHYGFTIKTTVQRLDLLNIRSMHLVPRYDYSSSVPLQDREYLMKLQVAVPGGLPAELPDVTCPQQILGFDRGSKKNAAVSNGMEVQYNPALDMAEQKEDWKKVRAKKKGSNRRHKARQTASKKSRTRRERRKALKRNQIREILQEARPLAVAVESIRLPNLLASAAGTEEHPGVNVSAKGPSTAPSAKQKWEKPTCSSAGSAKGLA